MDTEPSSASARSTRLAENEVEFCVLRLVAAPMLKLPVVDE
jgi:hypothetical protein